MRRSFPDRPRATSLEGRTRHTITVGLSGSIAGCLLWILFQAISVGLYMNCRSACDSVSGLGRTNPYCFVDPTCQSAAGVSLNQYNLENDRTFSSLSKPRIAVFLTIVYLVLYTAIRVPTLRYRVAIMAAVFTWCALEELRWFLILAQQNYIAEATVILITFAGFTLVFGASGRRGAARHGVRIDLNT